MKNYDVIIVGGGAGGLFAAYEFVKNNSGLKIAILEKGNPLHKRKCPIDGNKIKNCIKCKDCSIMTGIGGAGAFSDGKYNITNNFGGDLAMYVGPEKAIELMEYVDTINMAMGGEGTKRYSTVDSSLKREALKYDLHLLDASVRHLGTDKNYVILTNIVKYIEPYIDIICNTEVLDIVDTDPNGDGYQDTPHWMLTTEKETYIARDVIVCTGRSGSAWTKKICERLNIPTKSNRVDIGVRFECPAEAWDHITDKVYESKILYRSPKTGCTCRTFCMNPHGFVCSEQTGDYVSVNGHSFSEDNAAKRTNNTNFALLVTHHFTEPFKDSNAYGEAIARLSNMLAGGVMVQRFGDLIANRRTNEKRLAESFVRPTLTATPGNLALVLPKMTLDTIIDMIYALDKICPATANYDSLLYGVELKQYNSQVEVNNEFMTKSEGLYMCGDGAGITHSLSQAASCAVATARTIMNKRRLIDDNSIRNK